MTLPRDFQCWHCERSRHARCGIPNACACYTCHPRQAGAREPVTIAGRPWVRVWRDDGTYGFEPVPDAEDSAR